MSAAHAPLARRLLPLAADALASTHADARAPLLAALDAFLAAPSPSRFLAAWRVLSHARDDDTARRLRLAADARALPAARALVEKSAALPRHAVDELLSIPADGGTSRRLRAVALLVEARAELEGRVEARLAERRAFLERAGSIKPRSSRPPSSSG